MYLIAFVHHVFYNLPLITSIVADFEYGTKLLQYSYHCRVAVSPLRLGLVHQLSCLVTVLQFVCDSILVHFCSLNAVQLCCG